MEIICYLSLEGLNDIAFVYPLQILIHTGNTAISKREVTDTATRIFRAASGNIVKFKALNFMPILFLKRIEYLHKPLQSLLIN